MLGKVIHSLKNDGLKKTAGKVIVRLRKNVSQADSALEPDPRKFHMISDRERERQKAYRFEDPVTFSILTPLYNTKEEYLEDLIGSLKNQTYPGWELCLADGSDEEHGYVEEICRKYAEEDPRIVYSRLTENKGISENTNACLKISTGSYFGLLDHDDILHESALYEMMRAIERTGADFLYSDEGRFTDNIEEAFGFNFKPDFGKDELRSHNFICHFTVFKRTLLERTGEVYRPAFDGSQDHDMVLRLTEKAEKIFHIPRVLYYWRVHPESVSMNLGSKHYAVDAAIRAVQEQLDRTGETGKVASNLPYETIYRVRYDLPESATVAVCTFQEESAGGIRRELLFQKGEVALHYVPVVIRENETLGAAANRILSKISEEYVIFKDSRCVPEGDEEDPQWIDEMLMFAQRKDVGLASPAIYSENGTVVYAGCALDNTVPSKIRFLCRGIPEEEQGYEAILRHVRNTSIVWTGCFMAKAERIREAGGFAEDLPGYEAADLSLKLRDAGYWNVWTPFSKLVYKGGEAPEPSEEETAAFAERRASDLKKRDPFYHPFWRKLGLV